MIIDVSEYVSNTPKVNLKLHIEGNAPSITTIIYNDSVLHTFVIKYLMSDTKEIIKSVLFYFHQYNGGFEGYTEISDVYNKLAEGVVF